MRTLYKSIFLLLFSLLSSLITAQTLNKGYLEYIEQYSRLAQQQQTEFGIPASITLAQGLLESGGGRGDLAVKSNNHFGIKCKDWNGETVSHDDDLKGECFRKYTQVVDSYKDHSLFLKNRKHYAFLFDLKPTDYKGWAYGLKKAGYATDPTYPSKLIALIENYDLHRFDVSEMALEITKSSVGTVGDSYGRIGSIKSSVNHDVFKVNGIQFVTSLHGDTYGSISEEFELNEIRLRNYNEVSVTAILNEGMRVFLAPKKNKAPQGYESHRISESESMHSVSQDYGVKVAKLYELNMMAYSEGAQLGQVLKLR